MGKVLNALRATADLAVLGGAAAFAYDRSARPALALDWYWSTTSEAEGYVRWESGEVVSVQPGEPGWLRLVVKNKGRKGAPALLNVIAPTFVDFQQFNLRTREWSLPLIGSENARIGAPTPSVQWFAPEREWPADFCWMNIFSVGVPEDVPVGVDQFRIGFHLTAERLRLPELSEGISDERLILIEG